MTKWKPIETAPRDGTPILVYVGGSHDIEGGAIITVTWCRRWRGQWVEGWVLCMGSAPKINPTHWTPLLGPPDHRAGDKKED